MKKAKIKIRRETLQPLQEQADWSQHVAAASGGPIRSVCIGCNQ